MTKDAGDDSDSGWWSFSDIGHGVLDIAGFVPGYGEAADVANAAWYAGEGEYLDAGLSLISIIPIVGDVIGKGGRVAKHLGPRAIKVILDALKKMDVPKFLERFKSNPDLAPHIDKISDALKKWQDELHKRFDLGDPSKGIKECPYKCSITSNGATLKPNPNKTTTVLGRFDKDMDRIINKELEIPKNTDFGPRKGGFNVLNVPDEMYKNPDQFWKEINQPFLDKAITRGDDIVMASDPEDINNLVRNGKLTGFGQEVQHLIKNEYRYDSVTKMMVKKGN